jgi:4-hydroxy-3-polyprenylbenzoate decarboxylase
MQNAGVKAMDTRIEQDAPGDFHEQLARLERRGLLVRIDRPICKDTELHPLMRWQFTGGLPESERRAFLFTNVHGADGRRFDMAVVVGALAASSEIYAVGMGVPVEEIGNVWTRGMDHPIEPVRVENPPCQEIVMTGDALRAPGGGLASLPVPISTPGFDAAPYLTATLCVTKDPETGVRNMGTYRAALKAPDRLGVRMASRLSGAGGYQHWLKCRDRGEKMPIAIVVGAAPSVMYTGPQKLRIDEDEMAVAGGLAGRPIRMCKALTVDLDIPADAEIVVEGLIDTDALEPEGPFGESHGHVAFESFNMSMHVTAITRRRDAIFASIISEVTPSESSVIKKVAYEPLFLNHLKRDLDVKGILRVVMHEPLSNLRPVIFLVFKQGALKTEVWRGLHGAATLQAQCGKICVAVSADVDPANTNAVFWSMAYRSNPVEDVLVIPNRATGHGSKGAANSTLLIDATAKHVMPPLALPAKPYMERAKAIWEELGLPRLAPQSPWHGYELGDWAELWQRFADNAVAGAWELNGAQTWERRKPGLIPETPVRKIETVK